MFSSACHRGVFSQAVGGIFNMLRNFAFSGAVAGSPGTFATNWTDASNGTGTLALATPGLTFSATTGNRQFQGQLVTLLANTTYTLSFKVTAISGGTASDNVAQITVSSGSATFPDTAGLGFLSATTAVVGRNRFQIVAGAAGAVIVVRLGVGCGAALIATCSVTIADPVLNWRPN